MSLLQEALRNPSESVRAAVDQTLGIRPWVGGWAIFAERSNTYISGPYATEHEAMSDLMESGP